jgi:DNA primase
MDENTHQLAQRIRNEIPIRDVVSETVNLNTDGQGICPFHCDSKPALRLNRSQNTWACYPCELAGDSIAFYMRIHDVRFHDAVSQLASRLTD